MAGLGFHLYRTIEPHGLSTCHEAKLWILKALT